MEAELVIVWNGTLERNWIRAQQCPPDPAQPKPASPAEDVLAYLTRHPLSTMRQVVEGTGRDLSQVNAALYALRQKGRVVRSESPSVRWSVR